MILKVTCAVIEQQGLVLVTQRSENMPEPLLWEFPGGKIQHGESEKECLVREVREELQIEVTPLQRLTPVVHQTPHRTIQLIPYICSYDSGTIQLLEHKAYKWVPAAELLLYNWCQPDVPIVQEYLLLRQAPRI